MKIIPSPHYTEKDGVKHLDFINTSLIEMEKSSIDALKFELRDISGNLINFDSNSCTDITIKIT